MAQIKISVTHTPYEGDDFAEAVHYNAYVIQELADRYDGAIIEADEGPVSRVRVIGSSDDGALEVEILDLVQVTLWEDFCAWGYQAFSGGAS